MQAEVEQLHPQQRQRQGDSMENQEEQLEQKSTFVEKVKQHEKIIIPVAIVFVMLLIGALLFLGKPKITTPGNESFSLDNQTGFSVTQNQDALRSYLQATVVKQYLKDAPIKPYKDGQTQLLSSKIFTTSWITPQKEGFVGLVRFNSNGNLEERHVDILLPNTIANLSELTAPTLANTYFALKPQGTWKCEPLTINTKTVTLCENFWRDAKTLIKRSIGVLSLLPSAGRAQVFTCERYKGSTNYFYLSCNPYKDQQEQKQLDNLKASKQIILPAAPK